MKNNIGATILILLVLLGAITASYLAGAPFRGLLLNSDGMYLPTLFAGVLAQGGHLRDWYLTPAPYYFPDFLLYLPAYLAGQDAFQQVLAYGLLQTLALFGALLLLARHAAHRSAALPATVLLAGLGLTAGEPFAYLFSNAYHYGVFLCSIALAGLWLWSNEGRKPWALGAMAALALLVSLSDSLFFVQAIAPFAASIVVFVLARQLAWRHALAGVVPVIASLLGLACRRSLVMHDTSYALVFGLNQAGANLGTIWRNLLELATHSLLFDLVLLVWLFALLNLLPQIVKRQAASPLAWLVLFSLFSIASSLAAMALLANLPMTPRYWIAAFSWPVVVAVLFLAGRFEQRFAWPALVASLALTLLLAVQSGRLAQEHGFDSTVYPPVYACMDRELRNARLDNGIAAYWDAKRYQGFSKLPLNVAQYDGSLNEARWITSGAYFKPTYDFAIVSENAPPEYKIPAEALVRINGAPQRIAHCGDKTLYLYGKDRMRVSPAP